MNEDQTDWFKLVADLIADYEKRTAPHRSGSPCPWRGGWPDCWKRMA
jgi:hypothetical protein